MAWWADLFEDIGEKIKASAKFFGRLFIIAGIIGGIISFFALLGEDFLLALITLIGSIGSGLLLLEICRLFYGLGEIISLLEIANGNTFYIHKLLKERIEEESK